MLTGDASDVYIVFDNSGTLATGRYLYSKATSANQYLSRALSIAGSKSGNYVLSSSGRDFEWEIKPRVLVISWNGLASYTYNNTTRNISASFTNVVSGDVVNITYITTGSSPAPNSRVYAVSAKMLANIGRKLLQFQILTIQ